MTQTTEAILRHIAEQIKGMFGVSVESITPATTALDVDGWDSLSHTLFMVRIEKLFNIRFATEDLFSLQNVGELAERIRALQNAGQSSPE